MAKQTFTSNQVLTAAQMTSLQQTAMGGGSTTAKTTSYVLVAADAGTTVAMNAAGSTTITVNTSLFSAGDSVFIQNWGAGTLTVTAGTATVSTHGSLALSQWEGGQLYFTSSSAAIFFDISQSTGMTNPMTTTGDTIYSSSGSTPAALPIGSTGQVLTVASGLPSWATPTGSGSNWSLFGSAALTGASTITISGISGKDKIMVLVSAASSASVNAEMYIRFNASSANYYNYGHYHQWFATYGSGNFENVNGSFSSIYGGKMSSNAASSVSGAATITGCNSSGVKQFIAVNNGNGAGGSGQYGFSVQGYWDNSATVSSVSLVSSVGNFDNGTLYVYTSVS
jgi:hypothetical protein